MKRRLSPDNLDFIRIQELANDETGYLDSGGVSWRAYAGLNRKFIDCEDCEQLELRAGLGKSAMLTESAFAYLVMDAGIETEQEDFVLTPSLGVVVGGNDTWKTHLEFGRQYFSETEREVDVAMLNSRIEIAKNHELWIFYLKNGGEVASASYRYYW